MLLTCQIVIGVTNVNNKVSNIGQIYQKLFKSCYICKNIGQVVI